MHIAKNEVFEVYVRLYRVVLGLDYMFMDDNAKSHRAFIVGDFLEEDDSRHTNWPSSFSDLNLIGHVWAGLVIIALLHFPFQVPSRHYKPRFWNNGLCCLKHFLAANFFTKHFNTNKQYEASCEVCTAEHGGHTPY